MGSSFIADNTGWIAFFFILAFVVWKFIIEPIANEGQPIEGQDPEQSDSH